MLWILLPYAAGTALSAAPWAWLLPPRQRPGWEQTLAGRFAASGANALLPFFGLAGEPCRLLWLEPSARAEGLAAIVTTRSNPDCHVVLRGGRDGPNYDADNVQRALDRLRAAELLPRVLTGGELHCNVPVSLDG